MKQMKGVLRNFRNNSVSIYKYLTSKECLFTLSLITI